jgi:hypothetical protein
MGGCWPSKRDSCQPIKNGCATYAALNQWPRILVTDFLGNFSAFVEDLDFSATISRTLPRIA